MLWLGFGSDNNVLFIQLLDVHTNSWITSSIWIIWIMDLTDRFNHIVNPARKISDSTRHSATPSNVSNSLTFCLEPVVRRGGARATATTDKFQKC